MAVEYRGVDRWPHGIREKVEKGTEFLRQTMNSAIENVPSSFDAADVRWEASVNAKGQPQYVLRVNHPDMADASATATFDPDDMQDDRNIRIRLYQLWGELLRNYEHHLKRSYR